MKYGHCRVFSEIIYFLIISQFGFPTSAVRLSFIFRVEFRERTGFHSCLERNHSELVYMISGGGSYIEAVLSSMGSTLSNQYLMLLSGSGIY